MAGLLDFIQTPGGVGLLSGIGAYAAGARRGTPINNIGRGIVGGMAGYNQYFVDQEAAAYKKAMADAMKQNAITARIRTEVEANKLKRKEAENKLLRGEAAGFMKTAMGQDVPVEAFDVDDEGNVYMLPDYPLESGFKQIADQQEETPLLATPQLGVYEVPQNTGINLVKPQPRKLGEVNQPMPVNPPKPTMPLVTPQQDALLSRQRTQRVLGMDDDQFMLFSQLPAKDQYSHLLKSFNAKKQTGKNFNLNQIKEIAQWSIASGQSFDLPGYGKMTPEIGKKVIENEMGLRKAGATQNAFSPVNMMAEQGAEKAASKEGTDIGEMAAAVEGKWSALDSVREAKEMLSLGIYSGYWGELKQTIAKASLGTIGDRQKAARTERFISYIGNTVVPRLVEFGGNDSNEEKQYLEAIMGGKISMEPEALASILDSSERKIQRGIERLQRQRKAYEEGKLPDLGPGPLREKASSPQKQQALPKKDGWKDL